MSAAWSCSRSSGHTAPGRFARTVLGRHHFGSGWITPQPKRGPCLEGATHAEAPAVVVCGWSLVRDLHKIGPTLWQYFPRRTISPSAELAN